MPSSQVTSDYVECPFCSVQVTIDPVRFIEGRSICCSNDHTFNVYAVYRDFYQRIPLATAIGDKLRDAVYRSYRVRGVDSDVSTIDSFLNAQNFELILRETILDTILYGNSILRTASAEPLRLERVDLADAVIQIEKGETFVQSTESERMRLGIDFIHFTHNRGSGGPMGLSAFGAWFQNFYLIRDAAQVLINASILRNLGIDPRGLSTVSQIRDYFARSILTGADLPGYQYSMISAPSQGLPTPVGILLRAALDTRRAEIRGRIERDVFPLVLGRAWQPTNWPAFDIIGL